MEIRWQEAILQAAEDVMVSGGKLEFIVLKREKNKRVPIINKFLDNQIICKEVVLID